MSTSFASQIYFSITTSTFAVQVEPHFGYNHFYWQFEFRTMEQHVQTYLKVRRASELDPLFKFKMAADPDPPQFIPLPSTANLVSPVDGTYITFPPFPKSAEGVTVMPFKAFKERGICIEPGADDAEIDALGIPTVPIRTRHSTDQCKSKSKRKMVQESNGKKGKKSKIIEQRLWWEQWEDAEAIRFCTGFNP